MDRTNDVGRVSRPGAVDVAYTASLEPDTATALAASGDAAYIGAPHRSHTPISK